MTSFPPIAIVGRSNNQNLNYDTETTTWQSRRTPASNRLLSSTIMATRHGSKALPIRSRNRRCKEDPTTFYNKNAVSLWLFLRHITHACVCISLFICSFLVPKNSWYCLLVGSTQMWAYHTTAFRGSNFLLAIPTTFSNICFETILQD